MQTGNQDPRARDSQKTREAILDAAEEVFAEHGFAGARIDSIARTSGYNSGLIFRYFGDKLGLYAEVLKRADREVDELLARVFTPWLENETAFSQARQFRALLETMIQTFFDYLLAHPRLVRILTWEMADGWQMLARITSQLPAGNSEQFATLFSKAWKAGLLRSAFLPKIQFSLVLQMCQTFLASLPVYRILLPDEKLASGESLARVREYLIDFMVAGMMADPERAKSLIP